jgi:hypothetical protein
MVLSVLSRSLFSQGLAVERVRGSCCAICTPLSTWGSPPNVVSSVLLHTLQTKILRRKTSCLGKRIKKNRILLFSISQETHKMNTWWAGPVCQTEYFYFPILWSWFRLILLLRIYTDTHCATLITCSLHGAQVEIPDVLKRDFIQNLLRAWSIQLTEIWNLRLKHFSRWESILIIYRTNYLSIFVQFIYLLLI